MSSRAIVGGRKRDQFVTGGDDQEGTSAGNAHERPLECTGNDLDHSRESCRGAAARALSLERIGARNDSIGIQPLCVTPCGMDFAGEE